MDVSQGVFEKRNPVFYALWTQINVFKLEPSRAGLYLFDQVRQYRVSSPYCFVGSQGVTGYHGDNSGRVR